MEIEYKGHQVKGTVDEIKKLIRHNPKKKMSNAHRLKIKKAMLKRWKKKLNK